MNDDLTAALEEIRARERNTVPGPWVAREKHGLWELLLGDDKHHRALVRVPTNGTWPGTAAGEFIANARSDVPRLLAALEAVLEMANWPGRGTAMARSEISRMLAQGKDPLPRKTGLRAALGEEAEVPREILRAGLRRIPHPFALDDLSLRCVCGLSADHDVHDYASLLDTRAFLNGTGGLRERFARSLAAEMTERGGSR